MVLKIKLNVWQNRTRANRQWGVVIVNTKPDGKRAGTIAAFFDEEEEAFKHVAVIKETFNLGRDQDVVVGHFDHDSGLLVEVIEL